MLRQWWLWHSQMFARDLQSDLGPLPPSLPGALRIFPCTREATAEAGNIPVSKAGSREKERPLPGHHRPGRSSEPEPKPPNRQPGIWSQGYFQAQQDALACSAALIITDGSSDQPWSLIPVQGFYTFCVLPASVVSAVFRSSSKINYFYWRRPLAKFGANSALAVMTRLSLHHCNSLHTLTNKTGWTANAMVDTRFMTRQA